MTPLDDVVTRVRKTYLHIAFLGGFASCWTDRAFDGPMLRYDGGFQGTFTDA